jgi:hypothetical protein
VRIQIGNRNRYRSRADQILDEIVWCACSGTLTTLQ